MNDIDLWIGKKAKELSEDANNLFQESILCFKIKAYRASLLFSYLGFMTFIKELIIKSKRPESIQETRWTNLINCLNKEDVWEQTVFQELINSTTPIFNISESIRQQIKYWKDRRNDCAHFKDNSIDFQLVETFWSFLKSNLPKITIEGGRQSLLRKFSIHFDSTKTPPNKDFSSLVLEIEFAVEKNELLVFFEELDLVLKEGLFYDFKILSETYYKMLTQLDNKSIKKILLGYIFSKQNYDLELLYFQPTILHEFCYNSEQIREIWIKRVYSLINYKRHAILTSLLRNNLIPQNELLEAMTLYFNKFDQEGFNNLPDDIEIKRTLANNELLDIIYEKYFKNNELSNYNYKQINSKSDLISLLFEFREIDFNMIFSIEELDIQGTRPNWLYKNLNQLFLRKPEKLQEYQDVCLKNNYDLSDFIQVVPKPNENFVDLLL